MKIENILLALIASPVIAESDKKIRGRIQLKWPNPREKIHEKEKLTICVRQFEHTPRAYLCADAPNDEFRWISNDIGTVAQGIISISEIGSSQVDFPFKFKWPVSQKSLLFFENHFFQNSTRNFLFPDNSL